MLVSARPSTSRWFPISFDCTLIYRVHGCTLPRLTGLLPSTRPATGMPHIPICNLQTVSNRMVPIVLQSHEEMDPPHTHQTYSDGLSRHLPSTLTCAVRRSSPQVSFAGGYPPSLLFSSHSAVSAFVGGDAFRQPLYPCEHFCARPARRSAFLLSFESVGAFPSASFCDKPL